MTRIALKARYILPMDGAPIDGGVVTLDGPRIARVGNTSPDVPAKDLGDVAILPGWVNAHAHLEFSRLAEPLGAAGVGMADWIRQVIGWREERNEAVDRGVQAGLDESVRCGTTTVGEIATGSGSDYQAASASADLVLFFEAIAFAAEGVVPMAEAIEQKVHAAVAAKQHRVGISPHAPYTVHPDLLDRLVELSARSRLPLAMHLAESQDEIRLLRDGSGPLRELLAERGIWRDDVIGHGTRPMDYLQRLAKAQRALVIHGNYLAAQELELLARHAGRMALVYCPRTHAFFQHDPYPLSKALQLGVHVALGTDSRASNPDLDLLAEMRFVAANHPAVRPETVLQMGTIHGARALGIDDQLGSLSPGKWANLTVVRWPVTGPANPYERMLDSAAKVTQTVTQTWYRGREIVRHK